MVDVVCYGGCVRYAFAGRPRSGRRRERRELRLGGGSRPEIRVGAAGRRCGRDVTGPLARAEQCVEGGVTRDTCDSELESRSLIIRYGRVRFNMVW